MAAVIGEKTFIADKVGVKKDFEYKFVRYSRIDTNTDFVEQSSGLISIGVNKKSSREAILISPTDEREVLNAWERFKSKNDRAFKELEDIRFSSPKEYIAKLLSYVNLFSSKSVSSSSYPDALSREEYLQRMISVYVGRKDVIDIGEGHKRAAIPLSKFMAHKCGVCRHMVLISCIVVASLVKNNLLEPGNVRQFRKANHAVMAYISEGKIWVLDNGNGSASAFYLIPSNQLSTNPKKHTNEYRALRFKKYLSEKIDPNFYDEMFARLLPNVNFAIAAAAPAKAADSLSAPAAAPLPTPAGVLKQTPGAFPAETYPPAAAVEPARANIDVDVKSAAEHGEMRMAVMAGVDLPDDWADELDEWLIRDFSADNGENLNNKINQFFEFDAREFMTDGICFNTVERKYRDELDRWCRLLNFSVQAGNSGDENDDNYSDPVAQASFMDSPPWGTIARNRMLLLDEDLLRGWTPPAEEIPSPTSTKPVVFIGPIYSSDTATNSNNITGMPAIPDKSMAASAITIKDADSAATVFPAVKQSAANK